MLPLCKVNYLAHILLSGENEEIQIGNFIGDFVKGKSHENFNKNIQKGILLHRFIDDYTDNHPKVKQDVNRLASKIGRYAPIAIDVFYDHLIAENWHEFHQKQSLRNFTQDFYQIASRNKSLMPEKCQHLFFYMKRDNWLENYAEEKGIARALNGLSRRTKFPSYLNESLPYLLECKNEILDDFPAFFNQLKAESSLFLKV